jgi:nucleoside-diphosphate-sugar epimerase|uniref:NAD-dependent epimerase/dehydratase family protein n=1 Tax=Algoriphagus sp. TaxID=1872435 RepID=UPI0025890280|nr:NAD-dependent epimerase/dehydratase family protein [Algoriphagus sp.]
MIIGITGANGFLGKILCQYLQKDHQVISIGKNLQNKISVDLSITVPDLPEMDLIIHSAGKAHLIPKSAEEKRDFFEVNVNGTSNLLSGIQRLPKLFIFISSVSVYGIDEGRNIDENFPTKGGNPYADSKIAAEGMILEWGQFHNVPVIILRLPLIAGPNPPGNLGAIIKAISNGYYFRLGVGDAQKSMVWAEDVAKLIPNLIGKSGIYQLCDGQHPKLAELDSAIAKHFNKNIRSIPRSILIPLSKIGDLLPFFPINTYRVKKLSQTLTFSDAKARTELGWSPSPVLEKLKEI